MEVVGVPPSATNMVDMPPDNPRVWMYHGHVNHHFAAGMTALQAVEVESAGPCAQ